MHALGLMRLWFRGAIAGLVLVGCTHDRSVLYRSERDAGAKPSKARVNPYTAALELFGSECAGCVAAKCSKEAHECADSRDCAAEVTCRHETKDPPSNERCDVGYTLGREPMVPLAKCAAVGCKDECPVGQDYACVGAYTWANPETAVSVVRLQLGQFTAAGDAAPLIEEGIRVRACASRSDPACSTLAREPQHSTAEGRVEVILPSDGGNNQGYRLFKGFLAFDDPDRDPPRVRPTLLLFDRWWPALGEPYIDGWIDALMVTPQSPFGQWSPGTGFILAVIFDCRANEVARGVGLKLEVDAAPDQQPFYENGNMTGRQGSVFFPNVPPGTTEVRALYGEQVVTRITVPVVADTVTYLWLWPSTTAP
jgi:hypothetical protein